MQPAAKQLYLSKSTTYAVKIDRIYRPIFGFYRYIGIGLSRGWQNAVIFLMYADTFRKEAQWTKSRQLSCSSASRCVFISKQTRWTLKHALAVAAETKALSVIRLI